MSGACLVAHTHSTHLQALVFVGGLVQRFPWIRDRMIFDDKYLFKVLAECLIDSGGCAAAPVQEMGEGKQVHKAMQTWASSKGGQAWQR